MASCEVETRTIKVAAEAWYARGGYPTPWPRSEVELVDVGLLAEQPSLHVMEGDGSSPPEIWNVDARCGSEEIIQIDG